MTEEKAKKVRDLMDEIWVLESRRNRIGRTTRAVFYTGDSQSYVTLTKEEVNAVYDYIGKQIEKCREELMKL